MIAATETHTASPPNVDFVHLLDIARGEYLEMPGLRLTRRQAQRLWALDTTTCDALLDALERAQFLRRTEKGEYMLAFRSQ
jgi:hypothetical protein